MLSELHIQNIAVIQQARIPFTSGLNIFTGETGAGKTMLISAIDAALGERTSKDIIRAGEEKAQVTAVFIGLAKPVQKQLLAMGIPCEEDTLIITREITQTGKNSCRMNGMPATVTMLRDVAGNLIHIHGQRDTGQLLSADTHLKLVDEYGDLSSAIADYQELFGFLRERQAAYRALDMDEQQKVQRLDLLKFQIEELELAKLDNSNEEMQLQAYKSKAHGSEKIRKGLSAAVTAYEGSGDVAGIGELLDVLLGGIEQAEPYLQDLTEVLEQVRDISYSLKDLVLDLEAELDDLDFDEHELDKVEERLDVIYHLKRKYGSSIPEIQQYYQQIVQEYEAITFSDSRKEKLQAEIVKLQQQAEDLATSLSRKRARACKKFMAEVEQQLKFLNMPYVNLSVQHKKVPLSSTGTDELEFLITPNLGEEPKPLGKIASGGELARVMLAIQDVLANKNEIETLVFDEIDTGVSGKTAGKIGRKLADVAKNKQVICVTHLAQVAAFADNHLLIDKSIAQKRTYTTVKQLDREQSVHEIARITSGEMITEASLNAARELIEHAHET